MATPARRGDWLRTFRGQVAPWEACLSGAAHCGWSSIHERPIQRVHQGDGSARRPRGRHRGEPGTARGAASESGTPIGELDESDIVACADDEFLCSETLALWAMIRKARALAGKT